MSTSQIIHACRPRSVATALCLLAACLLLAGGVPGAAGAGSLTGVSGTVKDTAGAGVPGARLALCPLQQGPSCLSGASGANGGFVFTGVAEGGWSLTVFPPAGSPLGSASLPTVVAGAAGIVVVLEGPEPVQPETTVEPTNGDAPGGRPSVNDQDFVQVTTHQCPGAVLKAQLHVDNDGYETIIRLDENPPGTYSGSFGKLKPHHGAAKIRIFGDCPAGAGGPIDAQFGIFIDPSGTVQTTGGLRVAGATVTLYRADTAAGPFAQVPDGSAILSPGNRANPDLSRDDGEYGWDVLAGFYVVRAEKAGCFAPGNPGRAYFESPVLPIPPAVTDLVLPLACPAADLAALQALIAGMGLDSVLATDLAKLAREAGDSAAAGLWDASCASLTSLVQRAIGKTGKVGPRLTIVQAKALLASANAIASGIGCLAAGSFVPAAENAVLDLVGAINTLDITDAPWNELRADAQVAGKSLAAGAAADACTALRALDDVAAKKLPAPPYAQLAPSIAAALSASRC